MARQRTVSGSANGPVQMRRSVAERVWTVECPDGTQQDVTGDTAAYEAAARCGGSYQVKQ